MTSLTIVVELAQDNRPDGPPWFKWLFLAVWVLVTPWVIYKLHRDGYFKRRH